MAELKIIRMSDIKAEPVEWLWEPYIPFGTISLIQGDGGDGKTTTALAIAAAVTTGKALPGCGGTVPAPVIIQNAEDSYAITIRPRLERFGADCDKIHVIDEEEQALSLSEYDVTIEELLGDKKKPDSQFIKARRLIKSALSKGPALAADMMQMAEEQGISPKTLNRAKEALGVLSVKRGVKWYWELPIDVDYTEVGQDGQHGHDGRRDAGHGESVTDMTTLTMLPCGGEG